MRDENPAKKESQSMALLEKLIRIDSKDCNFHFRDQLSHAYFKVSYQQTNIQNHSNEALLRQFWHHVYAHYFKKIQPEELRRLSYLSTLMNSSENLQGGPGAHLPSFLREHPQFQQRMHGILSDSYLLRLREQQKTDKEMDIWLKQLLMQTKSEQLSLALSKEGKRKTKLIYSKLKQNRRQRKLIKNQKAKTAALRNDQKSIDQLLEELQGLSATHSSEIDRQINRLQQEKDRLDQDLEELVPQLEDKIEEENLQCKNMTYARNIVYGTGEQRDPSKDLECLEYLIKSLEEKQIAESVAKIISTERAKGEIMFKVDFEKAMNIEPKLYSEKELNRINFLRETSLINFYRTGVKSLYSFICHNYVGFRELMQNRLSISHRLKDKDLVLMMKKGACLASLSEIQHQMSNFGMCHHCKFLYQDHLLFTCKFTSDKQAIPKLNIEASCDPNLSETFQEGPHRNRTSQRFMTRKKNCLTSYAKIHDEYVCGRKYCFSCLKDSYSQDNIKENGLCPFCLGICICTRCLRNEKIAKFKSMYSILGGDLAELQEKSMIQKLQVKIDEQIPRGRGRPKKYTVSHIAVNATQKKLRRFDQKENYCTGALMAKKGKRKHQSYSYWYGIPNARKKNDSGNDTQEQTDHKRRVKRRVGRPRLDRSGQGNPVKKYAHYA